MMLHVLLSLLLSFLTRGVLCVDEANAGDLEYYSKHIINKFGEEFESMLDNWMSESLAQGGTPAIVSPVPSEVVVEMPTDAVNTNSTYSGANQSVTYEIDPAEVLNDANIYSFFDKVRLLIQDPLTLPEKSRMRNLPDYVVMYGAISDAQIEGLSRYNITSVQVNTSPLAVTTAFKWETANLNGQYELDINGPRVHVYGKGPFRINVTDMILGMNVSLNENENKLLGLEAFQVDFKIANVTMKLENFMDGGAAGDVANSVLSELIPEALSFVMPQMKNIIERKTVSYINMFLSTMNVQNITSFIQNYLAA